MVVGFFVVFFFAACLFFSVLFSFLVFVFVLVLFVFCYCLRSFLLFLLPLCPPGSCALSFSFVVVVVCLSVFFPFCSVFGVCFCSSSFCFLLLFKFISSLSLTSLSAWW